MTAKNAESSKNARFRRTTTLVLAVALGWGALGTPNLFAQDFAETPPSDAAWKNAENGPNAASSGASAVSKPIGATFGTVANVDAGTFVGPKTTSYALEFELPKSDGQFWVAYDVAGYSERFPNLPNPQNSIVDWIMFDAGDDFWRREPFSAFSASRDRLYVYHNETVQRYVANVVDRFLDPTRRNVSFSIRVVAVKSPDWRARVSRYLTPLRPTVVGNGADPQGWLVEKADLAKVYAEVKKRSDFVLLNSGRDVVPNAETFGWTSVAPKKELTRDVRLDSTAPAGYVSDVAAVDEGFRIETTPLLSGNGETVEALVRHRATVVEKTTTFGLRVPTETAPRQRLDVERPSIVSCDVRVKLAFPRAKGAILDLGAVPLILPKTSETGGVVGSVSRIVAPPSSFYNVVVFVEEAAN
ncbi:MAG: hypothetical protein IKU86_00050 [Thermoguttaceae bacterium]|nr:hypothetical protein [Thermoguttaceae bacterium]